MPLGPNSGSSIRGTSRESRRRTLVGNVNRKFPDPPRNYKLGNVLAASTGSNRRLQKKSVKNVKGQVSEKRAASVKSGTNPTKRSRRAIVGNKKK